MRTYRTNNSNSNCNNDGRRMRRIVTQVAAALAASGGLTVRTTGGACGVPRQSTSDCNSTTPCMDFLTCQTKEAQNAANRTGYYQAANFPALAPQAQTSAAVLTAMSTTLGAIDSMTMTGRWRTVVITDLTSTLTSLDSFLVVVKVAGIVRFSLNGGRFARSNANSSTQACGFSVCAGPFETVSITFVNNSGAAFGATDQATVEVRTFYAGEDGFNCSPNCVEEKPPSEECECIEPGASTGFEEVL